jgi:CxxC motif-containing protein (DUF1111 family)
MGLGIAMRKVQLSRSKNSPKLSVFSRALLLASAFPLGLGCSSPGPVSEAAPTPVQALGQDPGPRPGLAAAGAPFPGLSPAEKDVFFESLDVFKEVDSVRGDVPEEEGKGLGPTFNSNGCASCHKQPAIGGSSPALSSPQTDVAVENPQIAVATVNGATNSVPPFVLPGGPIREARFKTDGGVHGLFTIQGRTDAPGCTLSQPDFAGELAKGNVSFRIPTPIFGLGLVENTPDSVLIANLAADSGPKQALGINGTFNTSGNDGTITRFGWKAQNKSLFIFAGEAYNVEQGVSNEVFSNERDAAQNCVFNDVPEDGISGTSVENATKLSDVASFALFMRLSAPPATGELTTQSSHGLELFTHIGCIGCHSPTLTTGRSPFSGMSNIAYHPFSDFALHHMGDRLADGIPQGAAGPDQFRTAPLWGVGQRLFFLHDGRTNRLEEAVEQHTGAGSEANAVLANFNALSAADQSDVFAFLRSL